MATTTRSSRTCAKITYRATTADRRKHRKAESNSLDKRRVSAAGFIPVAEFAKSASPTALAVAVNRALKASRHSSQGYLLAASLISASSFLHAQEFPATFNLSDLDGDNGFVIRGVDVESRSGFSVSDAGDINADGVADVIIGTNTRRSNGEVTAGQAYVVFGGEDVGSNGSLDLSSLDGNNGFLVTGSDVDSGRLVASGAGDINGDGVDDVIIGAPFAPPNGTGDEQESGYAGRSYVVFGSAAVGNSGSLDVSTLDGGDGFVINGVNPLDNSSYSVSRAGDINADGVDDVIVGGLRASEIYIVFGGDDVGGEGSLDLSSLNGVNGFVFSGESGRFGESVSNAGDINGDGVDDVMIGAPRATVSGVYDIGQTYVVFGGNDVGSAGRLAVSDLDGANGFAINGVEGNDNSGYSVSGVDDFNGDGVDDVVIGTFTIGIQTVIDSYVVFGGSGVGGGGSLELSSLDGSNGFVLTGIEAFGAFGRPVSGAGDINGDGLPDIVIGTSNYADRRDGASADRFVVFGGSDVGTSGSFDLTGLNGTNGFAINGINDTNGSGGSVSGAGDFNGDGMDDLIVSAKYAYANGVSQSGESYVLFGISDTPVISPPEGPEDAPENDQFENAIFLDSADKALVSGLTLTIQGTTVDATAQSGEPAHFEGDSGLPPGPQNSIWYRWTPVADQVVEIDTDGSEVRTVLVAYTGDTLSQLQQIATGIDNVREVSRIRFAVRAGETYHFAIDGYDDNSEGSIQLNLRQPRLDPSECTIKGTNGSDSLVGTPGPDIICALDGDDVIKSLGGDDIIFAGRGSDFVSADADNDIVFGEEGDDVLTGASGDDVLIGGPGNDQLSGASGNDSVFGGSGSDRLTGSSGNDELFGESHEDRLTGGSGNDYLDGGASKDVCMDSEGDDTFVSC